MSDKLIELIGVEKSYQDGGRRRIVLAGISMTIDAGRLVGILGESGGGKTTLARIISGQERPDAGSVLLDGQLLPPLRQRSFAQAAAIQYIFQDAYAAMDGRMTVAATLGEPVRLCKRHGHGCLTAAEAFTHVGLGPYPQWAERRVRELSGGQRQRLAIARALIPRPRLIIADESTSMLDHETAAEILAVLRELNRASALSILMISHQLQVVAPWCQEIHVLYQSKMVESGPTAQILDSPQSPYVQALVESMKYILEGVPSNI